MGLTFRKEHKRASWAVTKTRRWKALRLRILERDDWRCVKCGDLKFLEVDHIQSVRARPDLSYAPGNLQTLCRRCHADKTRHEVGFRPISPARQAWRELLKEPLEC